MHKTRALQFLRTATRKDFRTVVMTFVEGDPQRHHVLAEEAETMRAALHRLHVDPGVNPHTHGATTPAKNIEIKDLDDGIDTTNLVPEGPYWWSTLDLQSNDDSRGAVLFEVRT